MQFASFIEWTRLAISALTLVSIVIAYMTYRENLRKINDDRLRERDKEYVGQFRASLEWAFDALAPDGPGKAPRADRLNWLTSARHILRAKKIRTLIQHSTYATIADEIEEHWRHRFYLALSHEDLRDGHYYMDREHPTSPENIEVTSALVVVNFTNWKDGMVDPTDEVDREALLGQLKGYYAGLGLMTYINQLKGVKSERAT